MAEEKNDRVTLEMVEKILKKVEKNEDVKIVDFFSGPSSERGENWTSNMIRFDFTANVNGIEKEYHWIGKFPPTSPDRQMFHKQSRLDEKETRGYSELFPALNQFIKESGLENEIKLNFPPCPYAELEKDDFYFFMENMKENGYTEEVDKKLGIDVEHVKVVLDELARYHSTSHAYIMNKAKQSSLDQVLAETEIYTRDFLYTDPPEETKETLAGFGDAFHQGLITNTEALEDPGDNFVGPLKRYFEKGEDKSHFNLKERQLNPKEFNVLIHNDLWFNNMLFKYEFENGVPVPKQVSLVDMAMYCWRSPAIDLSYFFFMSLQPEMRRKYEDELLEFYHTKLVGYLEKFGIPSTVYPLSQLKLDYNKKLMVGLIPSMTSLTVILLPKEQALDHSDFDWADPEKLMEKSGNLAIRTLKAYPKIRNWMRANFLEVLDKGIIC